MLKAIFYFSNREFKKKIILQSLKPSSVSSTTLKLIHCQKRGNFERGIYHNSQPLSFYSFSLRERKLLQSQVTQLALYQSMKEERKKEFDYYK